MLRAIDLSHQTAGLLAVRSDVVGRLVALHAEVPLLFDPHSPDHTQPDISTGLL